MAFTKMKPFVANSLATEQFHVNPKNENVIKEERDTGKPVINKGKGVCLGVDNKFTTPTENRRIGVMEDVYNSLLENTDVMELSDDDEGMYHVGRLSNTDKLGFQKKINRIDSNSSRGWERLSMPDLIQSNVDTFKVKYFPHL